MRIAFCWLLALGLLLGAHAENLSVTSRPRDVRVFVDGRACGTAPTDVLGLDPGRHRLSCRLAGYEDYDCFVTLGGGQTLSHDVEMKPVKGLLLVTSEPTGCSITIDGISYGMTPRLITTLDVKDVHRGTLRKAGYLEAPFEVRFTDRTPIVCRETLVLDSGVINVMTDPAGAEVMVNGIVRGRSPITVRDVQKGRATVRLRLEGYAEETRELAVNANESQTLSVPLKGLPGTLGLTSLPTGARFYVNDEYVGKSPVTLARLKPGDYEVRAEAEGYAPLTRTVKISSGASARKEFKLKSIMGWLEVRTSPAGAEIRLDGKLVGTTRSAGDDAEFSDVLYLRDLEDGEHVLTASRKGHATATRRAKIRPAKPAQANIRLKRVFTPDVRITTEAGTCDCVLIKNAPDFVTVEVTLGVLRSIPRGEIRKFEILDNETK